MFNPHPRTCLDLERGREGGKRERERETPISSLPYLPLPGNQPATQACALTADQTGNLSVHRMVFHQLSPSSKAKATSARAQPRTSALPCQRRSEIKKQLQTLDCRSFLRPRALDYSFRVPAQGLCGLAEGASELY